MFWATSRGKSLLQIVLCTLAVIIFMNPAYSANNLTTRSGQNKTGSTNPKKGSPTATNNTQQSPGNGNTEAAQPNQSTEGPPVKNQRPPPLQKNTPFP